MGKGWLLQEFFSSIYMESGCFLPKMFRKVAQVNTEPYLRPGQTGSILFMICEFQARIKNQLPFTRLQ